MERIQPISDKLTFRPFTSETLEYKDGKLLYSKTIPYKCLKIVGERYKVFVDYGFKGNARYADDQSDYYVVDTKNNTMYLPSSNDYSSIVASLETKLEKETPLEEKLAPFVSDIRVMTMTIQNLLQDGFRFEEKENGDLEVINEDGTSNSFRNDEKFKKWILKESENY